MANCPVPIGGTFAGKYRVDRVLGEGGMGIVVAAFHLELEQPVAVKFLLDDLRGNEEGAERFRREARAAAKIQSDHVVRVIDVGVLDSGERYMVMEYLEGRDLSEELALRRTLPIGVACGWMVEAIDAVGHAHAAGIVHRDLKPANLFLAHRPDGKIRVKVLDFGISKSFGTGAKAELSLTKTSSWIGSPLYMSPEQMQSARDVDHRADIWSLGAILYEMIAGRPPYMAESLPQLCNLLLTQDPQPIDQLVPIPEELALAIMGCLTRNVQQRTQTTAELAKILGRYATTLTGSGVNPSLLARTEILTPGPASSASGRGPVSSALGSASVGARSGTAPRGSSLTHADAEPPTAASWGGTQGASRTSSRKGLMVGVAALLVALAGAFVLLSRAPVSDLSASEGTSSASPALAAPVAPPVAPPPPAPVSSAPALTVPAPAPTSVVAPVSTASSVKTSAPTTAKPAKVPKTVRTDQADDSDFGGRR